MKRIDPLWLCCAIGFVGVAVASCVSPGNGNPGGFLNTGIGAPPPTPPQPEGFETVHWLAYAGGFLMIVVGAALFWLLQQPKAGGGLAATGFCTIALALGAAYYGKELALASMILMGAGILGGLGFLLWYAFRKKEQFAEVVTKANGQIERLDLTPSTALSVEHVKTREAKKKGKQ